MTALKVTNLTAAKRERASLLSALREGRAASKSKLTFNACLDRYLDALEHGGAREKTVRGNTRVAKRYLRDRLGAKPVQEITTDDVRKVLRSVKHLSSWTGRRSCR
jgi:Phage integrase central domain